MAGIFQKFLVFRRDGSVPEWPYLVLGGRDPEVPGAIRELARLAEENHRDPQYVSDLRALATRMEDYRAWHGEGDPDAPAHRTDDPEILELWEWRRSNDSGTVRKGQ